MKLIFNRVSFLSDGVYGELETEDSAMTLSTLEHAYLQTDQSYSPKLPPGEYICERSLHRLHHMTQSFTTFQVMNVPGHTDILFHIGNYNDDSDGCILLGTGIASLPSGGSMLIDSHVAFNRFMAKLIGLDNFTLVVS